MRTIAEPFFEASGAMLGPVVGLLFFVAMFTAVVVFVFRARDTELERAASLPFDSDHDDSASTKEVSS